MEITRTKLYFLLFCLACICIISVSAIYYSPCFYPYFNSDQAIPVLMAKNFQLPRDYYYWGQNRLGSLIPIIAHFICSIIKVHPVYVVSVVHYLFLFIPFLIISQLITNKWLRISLLGIIFLPFNSYNALLLIGHPYSQQLFCGTLFILFFLKAEMHLVRTSGQLLVKYDLLKITGYLGLSIVFYILGIWVSEFNFILALFPLVYILKRAKQYYTILGLKHLFTLLSSCILMFYFAFKWYAYTKAVSVNDELYNKAFFFDKAGISKQYDFMMKQVSSVFYFEGKETFFQNTIYIFLIFILLFLIFQRKQLNKAGALHPLALVVISISSCIVLFFSFWNLRSEFCPRYFTPVYLTLSIAIIIYLDRVNNYFIKPLFCVVVLFQCSWYSYYYLIRQHDTSPYKHYADFSQLPKGVLFGDYWEAHLINAVAIDNLQSINFQDEVVRVYGWRDTVLNAKKFYFMNNDVAKSHGLKDTIRQFDRTFVYTGTKYRLHAEEVLLYKKIP